MKMLDFFNIELLVKYYSEFLIKIKYCYSRNEFENVVHKMGAIPSSPQCINSLRPSDAYMR